MRVVVWVSEPGWPSAMDAASQIAGPDADVELVHVMGDAEEVVHGAFAGLFGRGRSVPATIDQAAMTAAQEVLDAAAARLAEGSPSKRQAGQEIRQGRVDRRWSPRAVPGAAGLARDGAGSADHPPPPSHPPGHPPEPRHLPPR